MTIYQLIEKVHLRKYCQVKVRKNALVTDKFALLDRQTLQVICFYYYITFGVLVVQWMEWQSSPVPCLGMLQPFCGICLVAP